MKTTISDSALSKNKFAESIFRIGSRYSVHKAFDDFLTMSIASCTQNLKTSKSYYEDEYLRTIANYKDSELRQEFPKAFASLVSEMEDRADSSLGNDVLGEFFETNISNGRNGQFFTPYPICNFMASVNHADWHCRLDEKADQKPLRILDTSCGSGRMLLAAHKVIGIGHEYYGIDIDRICVKIAAMNLFLNGVWQSEVMCANALKPDDFVMSYYISLFPLGIFKIEEKELSALWHLHKESFHEKVPQKHGDSPNFMDECLVKKLFKGSTSQLSLF